MTKIKILITSSTFPRFKDDSTPAFILDLCKNIQTWTKADCLVLVPQSEGALLYETLEGIKVKRYRYIYPDFLAQISGHGIIAKIKKNRFLVLLIPLFFFFQFIATVTAIRNYRPDILFANWIIPQGVIAYLIKSFCSPSIKIILYSLGGDVGLLQKNIFFRYLGNIILKKADTVVVVSNFLKKRLSELYPFYKDKIAVIPLGVNEKRFEECILKKEKERDKKLLFLGRLEEKKGVIYLLEAIKKVLVYYPDIILNICGDGTEKNFLIEMAKKLEIEKNVSFTGSISHSKTPEYFKEALIFVAPSINLPDDLEGLPTVVMEAIAAKLPVITTDAGGITDIIENYKTGIIVAQKSVDELSDKIIELIEKPDLRENLADNAYKKLLKDFTHRVAGEKFKEIIDNIRE